jgi:rubrerythrin
MRFASAPIPNFSPEELKGTAMPSKLFSTTGTPLDKQSFTWRELVQQPISKLDDDTYTRVRIILMNGIEHEALRFQHACARMNAELQLPLARVRRVEHHQATMVNWLIGADHSPLETTIAYEQVAIDVTAAVAMREPDDYLAQVYRFGLLEDFDHMYRYSALLDRIEGKDANNILQSYTDILPGRPTVIEHRAPEDDLRRPYAKQTAHPLSKLHALTIMAGEQQTHNFYMNIGPLYADPVARQLYAEIASIEEQHVTQYESIIDPRESWLEKWLMHEACEVYNYYGCVQQESNPRIKAIWERCLDYELGHLNLVSELFKQHEGRDPAEVLPDELPEPIPFGSQREFVRKVLAQEVDLRALGPDFVPKEKEGRASIAYRERLNASGSPSETVAAGYRWAPGTELRLKVVNY